MLLGQITQEEDEVASRTEDLRLAREEWVTLDNDESFARLTMHREAFQAAKGSLQAVRTRLEEVWIVKVLDDNECYIDSQTSFVIMIYSVCKVG